MGYPHPHVLALGTVARAWCMHTTVLNSDLIRNAIPTYLPVQACMQL